MRRPPTPVLVVDANIVLSGILGRRTRLTIADVGTRHRLVTSAQAERDVRHVASEAGRRRTGGEQSIDGFFSAIDILPGEIYEARAPLAEATLRRAVASGDGNSRDAHILALAWELDADIWSHDRDFAGTGVRSWSSSNLLAHLRAAEAAAEESH